MTRIAINGHARTHYGPRDYETKLPSVYETDQGLKVQSITFDYDDLPTYGTDKAILEIPANSFIESATLRVVTAFAGGTSYDIGLYQSDGTVIDAAGIDSGILLAAIDTVGETVICNGALVASTAGIGSAAGQVVVAETGTFTAGRAVLDVRYRTLDNRAS